MNFIKTQFQKPLEQKFYNANSKTLVINSKDEKMWIKKGCMIAYYGAVTFEREGIMQGGFSKWLKETFTNEGMCLMKAVTKGSGQIFCADQGMNVINIPLDKGESLVVNGNDVLAFEDSVKWDIKTNNSIASIRSSGWVNMHLTGPGWVSILTHGDPVFLPVNKDCPLKTDPENTVAWSATLTVNFKVDLSMKLLIGRESGEENQMAFSGTGFVIVQPCQEFGNAHAQNKK